MAQEIGSAGEAAGPVGVEEIRNRLDRILEAIVAASDEISPGPQRGQDCGEDYLLALNSIDSLEFMIGVECEFGIELTDRALASKSRSLHDLALFVLHSIA